MVLETIVLLLGQCVTNQKSLHKNAQSEEHFIWKFYLKKTFLK